MPTPDESFISTAAGLVRVYRVTLFDDTGTLQTVDQQVVAIADADGNPVAFGDMAVLLAELVAEVRQLRRGLAEVTGSPALLRDGE